MRARMLMVILVLCVGGEPVWAEDERGRRGGSDRGLEGNGGESIFSWLDEDDEHGGEEEESGMRRGRGRGRGRGEGDGDGEGGRGGRGGGPRGGGGGGESGGEEVEEGGAEAEDRDSGEGVVEMGDGFVTTITGIDGRSVTYARGWFETGGDRTLPLADVALITSGTLARRTQAFQPGMELSGGLEHLLFDEARDGGRGVRARLVIEEDRIVEINVLVTEVTQEESIAVRPKRPPMKE